MQHTDHLEKMLPRSIEAEQGVLGSILIDPEAIALVADFLRPDDFSRNAHTCIYEAMLRLYERHEPPDVITVCDELERRNRMEDAGGFTVMNDLVAAVPTSGNVEYYGRIVEREALLRRLIHGAGQIAALAYAHDPQAMTKAEEIIYSISQGKKVSRVSSISDVMNRYMNKLDVLHNQRQRGIVTGVPTGFRTLDQVLGGLQPSDLIVLAARPAMGKTSLSLNIAQHVMGHSVRAGHKVLMFSLEMGEEQLARRLLSMDTGIDQTRLRTADIDDEEWESITQSMGHLSEGRMWIDDTPAISLMDMRSRARRLQMEQGLDLIIVDYMQLMKATVEGGKAAENRVQEVSLLSRGLKELARELNVPVLALAQLSRAVEQRHDKVPQLSDLRESGTIEADSDVVMFIHQDPNITPSQDGYVLNILVAKHRNGPTGIAPLRFNPRLTRFYDIVPDYIQEAE